RGEIDVIDVEGGQLGYSQPARVEQFQKSTVAQLERRGARRRLPERSHLVLGQDLRELRRPPGAGDAARRVGRGEALADEEAIEAAHGGELAPQAGRTAG